MGKRVNKRVELMERKMLKGMLAGEGEPGALAELVGIGLEGLADWMVAHRIWERYHGLLRLKRLRAERLASEHRATVVTGLLSLACQDKDKLSVGAQETMRRACVDVMRMELDEGKGRARGVAEEEHPVLGGNYIPSMGAFARQVLDELGRIGEVEDE